MKMDYCSIIRHDNGQAATPSEVSAELERQAREIEELRGCELRAQEYARLVVAANSEIAGLKAERASLERRIGSLCAERGAWADVRCYQLEQFCRLLDEVKTIDRATGCLERIKLAIDLAEQLSDWDVDGGRAPFADFLRNLATKDRQREDSSV